MFFWKEVETARFELETEAICTCGARMRTTLHFTTEAGRKTGAPIAESAYVCKSCGRGYEIIFNPQWREIPRKE